MDIIDTYMPQPDACPTGLTPRVARATELAIGLMTDESAKHKAGYTAENAIAFVEDLFTLDDTHAALSAREVREVTAAVQKQLALATAA
jgi:hypothetical protein